MAQLKTLISETHKLAYVWVPKCASSTMFQIFQVISGVPDADMCRRVDVTDEMLSRYGSRRIQTRRHKIKKFVASTDYSWFTIVREPYGRLISSYNNKIDFFAQKFAPDVFEKHIEQIAIARNNHTDIPKIRKKMQQDISFADFVNALHENGTNFDAHFIPQTAHINQDIVSYSAILKLETLQTDLPNFLETANVDAAVIARAMALPPRNQSVQSNLTPAILSAELRDKIYVHYAPRYGNFQRIDQRVLTAQRDALRSTRVLVGVRLFRPSPG